MTSLMGHVLHFQQSEIMAMPWDLAADYYADAIELMKAGSGRLL